MSAYKRLGIALLVLACAGATVGATDYTFNVTDGTWHVPGNWQPPGGPPGAEDSATILTGQTCRIVDQDEAINLLTAQSGATLVIDGTAGFRKLRLVRGDGPIYRVTLNGLIEAFGATRLQTEGYVGVLGDGTIRATGPGNTLEINWLWPYAIQDFYLGDATNAPTIKGSVTFLVSVYNYGHLIVDDPGDVMVFGGYKYYNMFCFLVGPGEYRATAGQMRFRATWPDEFTFTGPWLIEGGTMELTTDASIQWINVRHPVYLSGGVLDLKKWFRTKGALEFTGGKMRVGPNLFVLFTRPTE